MSEFYSLFKSTRYGGTAPRVAGEDNMANKGMLIQITHVPTGKTINFKAFITAFNESYKPNWATETVFGRMDPIYLFKNTVRSITMAFKVPAVTSGEAYENLGKAQMLAQFLYPTYKNPAQAQTIVQAPLVRIKVMNLMRNVNGKSHNNNAAASTMYNDYDMSGDGLLGTISNMSLNHNLETNAGVIEKASGGSFQGILPRLIEVNLDFAPLHEHPLGWDEDDKFGQFGDENGELFPYGVGLKDSDPATSNAAAAADAAPTLPSDPALEAALVGSQNELPQLTPITVFGVDMGALSAQRRLPGALGMLARAGALQAAPAPESVEASVAAAEALVDNVAPTGPLKTTTSTPPGMYEEEEELTGYRLQRAMTEERDTRQEAAAIVQAQRDAEIAAIRAGELPSTYSYGTSRGGRPIHHRASQDRADWMKEE